MLIFTILSLNHYCLEYTPLSSGHHYHRVIELRITNLSVVDAEDDKNQTFQAHFKKPISSTKAKNKVFCSIPYATSLQVLS